MSKQSSGQDRYVKRGRSPLPRTIIDGVDLGPGIKPQDLMAWLRRLLEMEDREIAEAVAAAAACDPSEIWPELAEEDQSAILIAAHEVTTSRVKAWRTRNREMSWHDLRALLVGLRETM
jgi:hypothetical protein